jgi:hypothetical protein
LEEVAVRAGHKVLMESDDNIALGVGDPQGILGQQLKPRQSNTLIIIIVIFICLLDGH